MPGIDAGGVVAFGGDVQPLAVGLGEARLPRRFGPFTLLAIGGEGARLGAKVRVRTRGQKPAQAGRSEEHTSELQSLMRISYAVFCLKKNNHSKENNKNK